jgi:hypothetical protein
MEQGHTIGLPVIQTKSQYPKKTKRDVVKRVTRVVRMAIAVATVMAVIVAMVTVAVTSPRLERVVSRSQIATLLMQPPISLPFRWKYCKQAFAVFAFYSVPKERKGWGRAGRKAIALPLSPLADSEAMKYSVYQLDETGVPSTEFNLYGSRDMETEMGECSLSYCKHCTHWTHLL